MPGTPARPHATTTSNHNWAADLLGFKTIQGPSQKRTVEAEVDAYLLDTEIGATTLSYWQVGLTNNNFMTLADGSLRRQISFDIQLSSLMQWISSPSKALLFRVSVFFLLERKPIPRGAIASTPS